MIVKVRRFQTLARFRRYVRYCVSPKQRGELAPERVVHCESASVILPAPFSPADPAACAAAAKIVSDQFWDWATAARPGKPIPKYPVIAPIVTFHPDDHRKLTPALQAEIIQKLIARVMPGHRQVFLPIHGDTDHGHGHPSVGAVDADGKIWNPRFDYRLWEQGCEDLEIEYGLTRVRQRKACAKADRSREITKSAPRSSELQSAARARVAPPRLLLQAQIAGILRDSPDFSAFGDRLAAQQIRVVPNVASTGRVSGLTFYDAGGAAHKGSSLGKGFTFSAIAKITSYEQDRHCPIISRWLNQPADGFPDPANGGAAPRALGNQAGGLGACCSVGESLGASHDPEPSPFGRECPIGPRFELRSAAPAAAAGGLGASAQPTGGVQRSPGEAVGGPQRGHQAPGLEFLSQRWADLARRSASLLCDALAAVSRFVGTWLDRRRRPVCRPETCPAGPGRSGGVLAAIDPSTPTHPNFP